MNNYSDQHQWQNTNKLFTRGKISMPSVLLFCVALIIQGMVFCQDNASTAVRRMGDSIIMKIQEKKDPDQKFELILELLNLGADSDPLYTLELADRLYKLGQANKDKLMEASAWSYYGQGYRLTGNFSKAVECHYKAIEIAGEVGNMSVLGHSYNQLAHIYKDREENDKAIPLYHTARHYTQQGKVAIAKIWPLMNLGAVYMSAGRLDSSIYYSRRAFGDISKLKLSLRINYEPYILGNLGGAFSRMNKKEEAILHFDSALRVTTSSNFKNIRQKQILYVRLAEHSKRYQQQDSFFHYAKLAISLGDNTVFAYLNVKPARMLSEAYEKVNADSAIKYLKLFQATNELINSTRVTQQLQMMSFEDGQRRQEIEQAQKDARARLKIYLLLAGLFLLTVFVVLMFRNNKQKQKANLLLQKQKLEIENTLQKLTATQQQLVQAEKMASLGELTAGIAHEIQNPLNFVNNFSELTKELTTELNEELDKNDINAAKQVARDIAGNAEKIVHHGKRADAIVKSMLQHSRTNSGKKEPTDINALADEYLRLSYHGLRAKDKSFNAEMRTSFDSTIPMIEVIPQDIGRVLLNLINNAFYAVNEKQKIVNNGYVPLIEVGTKKQGDKIFIHVKDNGNGIPEKVLNKIWQPFFTTKPTGEGTGLGLSLSYDIITKGHGGDMKVETKEGEGTEFIISLQVHTIS